MVAQPPRTMRTRRRGARCGWSRTGSGPEWSAGTRGPSSPNGAPARGCKRPAPC